MGIQTVNQLNIATAVSAEQTVVTTSPFTVGPGQQGILIRGYITFTAGAGATGVTFRLYTLPSGNGHDAAIVQTNVPAGASEVVPISFRDPSSEWESGPIQYRITAQQTGAPTAAGNCTGEITVEV